MFYQRELTLNEIKTKAPSVFANQAASHTSNQYLYIPTAQIVDGLMKNDFIPVACKQVGKGDHGKHVIHFGHKSLIDRLSGQAELPLIRVQNSHDAKSSFQLDTGFFRLVCSNGLVMPAAKFNSARIRHNLGMKDEVIAASYRILSSFESQIADVEAMKSVHLDQDETTLLADSASRIVFDETVIDQNARHGVDLKAKLLFTRRHADNAHDLWTVFNRIQENSIKGGLRVYGETGKYAKMRAVNSIDREKQINVELMTLAHKMAELKGVKLTAVA